MSIANRILFGFVVLILMLAGLGWYGLSQLSLVRDTTDTIVTRDLAMMRQLDSVRTESLTVQEARNTAVSRFLLRRLDRSVPDDDSQRIWNDAHGRSEAAIRDARDRARRFGDSSVSEDRRRSWQRLNQALERGAGILGQMRGLTEKQFAAIRANDLEGVNAVSAPILTLSHELDTSLQQADAELDEALAAGQTVVAKTYEDSRFSVLAVLGVAVLVGVILAALVRRTISAPLSAFMEFVARVGRGDLSGAAAATGKDEIGQLGATLNGMVEGLRQLTRQSREVTENLNAAAAEIRASTQEQAAGVEEQLAAVQETAATADEITHTGTQIGKRAQEVITSAQAAARNSSAGLRAVDDTMRAMDSIREQAEAVASNIVSLSEKTQAIGEIIATVNDISERSHLLALNAAIEAAAAGEQGRSFAVVAAEMKTLADQAKEATGQVRSILSDIQRGISASVMLTEEAVKRVSAGKARTDTTHATIREITGSIQESVQTFQQIVASTNQQQLGIEQVMGALGNIRQASQQTAASTRQLDTAAGNLSQLAQQLVALADRYRL
ncbi:methyl-accepting chemotaxis protein [Roseomonas gilardii]|uniref:methyl-accepting chemotaxis protein n=1 Tax=Roseomonas gilardii TaxID=257708 RepID=UPI000B2C6811|nr:methyl-accepting chemotaxis protein [Roseomonas gilardii]